jgi:coenzyme F420-reducing hydrogenase delta subunit
VIDILSDLTGKVAPETVTVGGITLPVGEFDMRTRAAWLDVVSEYNLAEAQEKLQVEILPRMSNLTRDIESDPRLMSVQKRIDRLQERHDHLMELYASDNEPSDIDEQVSNLIVRLTELKKEMTTMTDRIRDEMVDYARQAEEMVGKLMLEQDRARIDFVWRTAKAAGKIDVTFDEFFQSCGSADYAAADDYIARGNAPWASLYASRVKPSKKIR